MSRPLRVEFPGAFYHVLCRGIERRNIFQDNNDYQQFLQLLEETAGRWEIMVHAYALMGNHYHLLLQTKGGVLSVPMRHLSGLYAQYFNRRHQRAGHLFQGRFKALLIEKDSYSLTLSRYIHKNPVKAKLAPFAWDYPWSSCRAYLGLAKVPIWLDTQDTLQEFGSKAEEQRQGYRRFLEEEEAEDIMDKAVGQLALGSKKFLETIKCKFIKPKTPKEHPYYKLWLTKISPETALKEICRIFKIEPDELLGGRYSREPARPMAMAILKNQARMGIAQIAQLFQLDDSAVSVGIKRLEQKMLADEALQLKYKDLVLEISKLSNVKM
ncbi:MAG: transposase [Elusimicrobia bacterium]|nr:transposase [Elusimicrobiota bacterium]